MGGIIMKYQVVKTDEGYVAVSNDEIKIGDFALHNSKEYREKYPKSTSIFVKCTQSNHFSIQEHWDKIVATDTSFKLEGVPQFELETLSWKDVLGIKAVEDSILAGKLNTEFNSPIYVIGYTSGFKSGYKAAQEKGCYTEADIKKAIEYGTLLAEYHFNDNIYMTDEQENIALTSKDTFIKSLKQPKEPVAIEVQECIIRHNQCVNKCASYPSECFCEMTKHVEITKSEQYPDGLLTVKKYYYE